VIETTGAGDTFCACVLNYVLEHGLDALSDDDLHKMLRFANTAAYLVTTKKGAIRSMPERGDVARIASK
jgi:fructokinase